MEDYAAKMQLKTDAALREYVTGYVQYREAAVLAAFDELRRRGQPAPEEEGLRPALQAAADAQRQVEAAAEAERQQALLASDPEAAEAASPSLYSPITIFVFSFFSMPVGAILLGKKKALLGLVAFVVAYLILGRIIISLAITQLGLNPVVGGMLFNIPAALAYVLWFWPRYVGATVYRSRSVLLPVLIYMLLAWGALKIIPYLPKGERQQLEHLMRR
jgi:hypothetical protein